MGPGTADAGVIVKPPSAKQPTPEQSFRASGTAISEALATKLAEHPPDHPAVRVSSVSVGFLVGWSSGCVLRAARPPEAAISALARSWPAFLHHWHRVARADCVTLVHGAVWNPHAWLNALRGGACRNAGQGNSGAQDESDETHGGTSLWVGLLRPERRSCANVAIIFAFAGAPHCEAVHTGRFFCRAG